jgi:hypothetical protein
MLVQGEHETAAVEVAPRHERRPRALGGDQPAEILSDVGDLRFGWGG